jgi:hypothetical protein
MYAVFTIILLILIRSWTRAACSGKVKKSAKKIGDHVKTTRKTVESFCNTALDLDLKTEDESEDISSKDTTDYLDTLFYGELLIASIGSGIIISLGWQ